MAVTKELAILGIRGVPAQHGGFETFAEYFCLFLVKRGWQVTVYCQEEGQGALYESEWNGIKRIHIPIANTGPVGSILFDLKAVWHSLRFKGVLLTLGYNTAIFNGLNRLAGQKNIINMDGIEWKRQKWGKLAKTWFWINELLGCWFATHLVADHPKIKEHLATRVSQDKITMIPYGGLEVVEADEQLLSDYGLKKDKYAVFIARAEPENSVLEMVRAFSSKPLGVKLVVLCKFEPESNAYHKAVINAACSDVVFPGTIYDVDKISALRFFCRFYVHGHQVGGTNPSLVEALGAGNAILAHDNVFNRWVAKDGALYFEDELSMVQAYEQLFNDDELINDLQVKTKINFQENFQWPGVLQQYELLLSDYLICRS